ncbi:methylated-DNA--[protein]-cysteine S-methyltransferase [Spirosoma sordidisoli]|uniref:Methylated-DNA--protein-cysteine methyltransferase n=1 Tax=Spirosoma sordidisoli TaxID=2502893 RepID=A0A4Q2UC60_9BACT|nr:methylated-DNA--[protein]-cysteine S-methyltransferase [Spirosoma sordidisoli]RYC66394.1 methylated-DNA--[protein]-cysteine S-methyltransferase [Spirosoma sordidisoli]
MISTVFESPIGLVQVMGTAEGVSAITCIDVLPGPELTPDTPEPVRQAVEQLQAYFAGSGQTFSFRLNPVGTAFQQTVWRALLDIPFGTTCSYLTLTRRIGDEKAIRAVAAANGRNPIAIVIPCHRVIGSNGSLTGYAGGLWRKQWLLEHEGTWPVKPTNPPGQLSLF